MAFQKAVKREAKARIALDGPAGSGKTWTALTWAQALAEGGKVAVIDTERGSASKYADLFEFDVLELSNYHPNNFIAGIKDAEAGGYAVLVIDSLSHAWNGTGGLLDLVDGIARRKYQGNSFAAWKDATPIQNALIDALTAAPLHVIITMRSKQEYVMEEKNGKPSPRKVGMAPIQRDGMEYEFDVVVDMDLDNTAVVQKSRCPALSGAIITKPDGAVMETLKGWLSGAPAPVVSPHSQTGTPARPSRPQPAPEPPEPNDATEQQLASIRKLCERLGKSEPENLASLTFAQAKALIGQLTAEYRASKTGEGAPSSAQAQDAPASREEVLHVFNRGVKAGWCKNTAESFAENAGDVLERPILAASVASSFHRDELHMLELAIAEYAAEQAREQQVAVK